MGVSHFANRLAVLGAVLPLLLLAGCPAQKEAISVSHDEYDFRASLQAWNLEVWNSNDSIEQLDIVVTTSDNWIYCSPTEVTTTGPEDVKLITVSVNRRGLPVGQYTGYIELTARSAKPIRVTISMWSDGNDGAEGSNLNIVGVSQFYSSPYLLDFTFSLRDNDNNPVIGEAPQFNVFCMEDARQTSSDENPPYFAKASNKQLKIFLVLDYTASMASIERHGDSDGDGISNAIEAMESAVKDVFLPSLNAAAQVGVYEFHRETPPQRVVDLTADKEFVSQRIDAIWTEYIASFWGASRCWDAVYAAIEEFAASENQNDENPNVIFISDGNDTSSLHTKKQIIKLANKNGVRIYSIGFGKDLNAATLEAIASETDGQFYPAQTPQELPGRFQQIGDDLDAQYALRWATLKRHKDSEFFPTFVVGIGGDSVGHTSEDLYVVADHEGDELAGILRLVPSQMASKTTYLLRARYAPRYIWRLLLFVQSPYLFTVEKVGVLDGGLCGDWSLEVYDDPIRRGVWIDLEAPDMGSINTPIPYAAFGPIVSFDFEQAFEDGAPPFTVFYVDNTLYSGGQSFEVDGWDNVLPE